jgi:hypothetical protein
MNFLSPAIVRERETRLYARFNRRLNFVSVSALYLQLALIAIQMIAGASWIFTSLNFFMCLSAIFIASIESEFLLMFLATNATWAFSLSSYLYSSAHLQVVDDNLWGADTSIEIVSTYNAACVLAYLLFRLIGRRKITPERDDESYRRALSLGFFKDGLLIFGVLLQIINVATRNPTISAIASQFSTLTWLGLAFHFIRKGRFEIDLKSGLFVASFAVIAASSNGRTILILAVFFLALSWLYYADRLLRPKFVLLALFGLNALSLFSEIAIDLRINHAESEEGRSIGDFATALLDPGNLVTLVDPLKQSRASKNIESTAVVLNTDNLFALSYYSGYDSMISRYVALPMLDVVCGRTFLRDTVNWDALENLFISLIPNHGQEKDLIYSDRVTWEMGLREFGNIGRPEITNVCELYTMSGMLGLFIITFFEFLIGFILLNKLKKVLVMPAVWISVIPQILVWMTVATTALTTVAVTSRTIPITMITVFGLYSIASSTRAVSTKTSNY